jgi:hypothetical protein
VDIVKIIESKGMLPQKIECRVLTRKSMDKSLPLQSRWHDLFLMAAWKDTLPESHGTKNLGFTYESSGGACRVY